MMSMDQWDWKPNAPEFVPGGISRGLPPPLSAGLPSGYPDAAAVPYAGAFSAPPYGPGAPGLPVDGGLGQGGLPPPPPPPPVHHDDFGPLAHAHAHSHSAGLPLPLPLSMPGPGPGPGPGAGLVMPGEDPSPLSQLRAQYEWQIQSKDQKLRDLQNRLSREEVERVQMQADFERDRQGLMRHLNQLVAAVERYGIPVEDAGGRDEEGKPLADAAHVAAHTKNRLDSKMEQLNSLLQGREEGHVRPGTGGGAPGGLSAKSNSVAFAGREEAAAGERPEARREVGRSALAMPGGGSSASRHRVTFPHDVVQPLTSARPWAEAERAVTALERRTGSTLDQQARQALEALGREGMREALRRVEDLIQGQGGRCSNLSSVLQSVCRKIRRRSTAAAVGADSAPAPSSGSGLGAPTLPQPCARLAGHAQEDARRQRHSLSSRPSAIDEEEEPGPESPMDPQLDPRLDSTARTDAREDPRSAGRKVPGPAARTPNPWSTTRFDKLSRQGAFELSRAGDGTWDLKICMSDLDPPLTDEGMQVYCRWLHQGLQRVRDECSLRSLRQIRAEVHFSRNGLSDDAVGRLLQALQRSELSVTCLNLFGNCIGPIGAHHVCDFLRGASFPLREVHLSHNKIDDEAALEMIHLLVEHPRYPPRRPRDGGGGEVLVPVWLRLNNNWIRDPAKVLRKAESQPGVTVSHSHSRHTGGPTVCGWLHLYRFDVQDTPLQSPDYAKEKLPGRRKERTSARLEGTISEAGPSPALGLHPGRNEVLGREAGALARAALDSGALADKAGPQTGAGAASGPGSGLAAGPGTAAAAAAAASAGGPESEDAARRVEGDHAVPPAAPGAPPPPPPVSSSDDSPPGAANAALLAAAAPTPTQHTALETPPPSAADLGTAEVTTTLHEAVPVPVPVPVTVPIVQGSGAPEQTPEPDGQLTGVVEVQEKPQEKILLAAAAEEGAQGQAAGAGAGTGAGPGAGGGTGVAVAHAPAPGPAPTTCLPSPPSPQPQPQPPVRMLVAPKILQRGTPPSSVAPESS